MKDSMKKLLYADDLTLVATINLENTELLHIGHHMEEMDIELEGEETYAGGQFRVSRRGSVRRREDGERST